MSSTSHAVPTQSRTPSRKNSSARLGSRVARCAARPCPGAARQPRLPTFGRSDVRSRRPSPAHDRRARAPRSDQPSGEDPADAIGRHRVEVAAIGTRSKSPPTTRARRAGPEARSRGRDLPGRPSGADPGGDLDPLASGENRPPVVLRCALRGGSPFAGSPGSPITNTRSVPSGRAGGSRAGCRSCEVAVREREPDGERLDHLAVAVGDEKLPVDTGRRAVDVQHEARASTQDRPELRWDEESPEEVAEVVHLVCGRVSFCSTSSSMRLRSTSRSAPSLPRGSLRPGAPSSANDRRTDHPRARRASRGTTW